MSLSRFTSTIESLMRIKWTRTKLNKLIGLIWGIYCPKCGRKLTYRGYYDEHSYCKHCYKDDTN